MTAIEHKELKGITVKNLVVTVMSTASIVASVMTTYFGLKTDIREIKASQETEARINNIRIKILENEVTMLQKEISEINISNAGSIPPVKSPSLLKSASPALLGAVGKR